MDWPLAHAIVGSIALGLLGQSLALGVIALLVLISQDLVTWHTEGGRW
ncbi:MAG: hypothetical protein JWM31_3090 [Solirubrobacterales bacterium]|nr:hypothetical protein [Solirubrobacterales bacterium]